MYWNWWTFSMSFIEVLCNVKGLGKIIGFE